MLRISKLIALLTDFGTRDHYVGSFKGILLSNDPHVNIIDITHSLDPFNIQEASYTLWASFRSFPRGTLFCCVVDPGVGSDRDIVLLSTKHYRFIAPANGLLDIVAADIDIEECVIVNVKRCQSLGIIPRTISATFHGRDIIAPLAASIAKGIQPALCGRQSFYPVRPIFFKKHEAPARVLSIDRFGNIITNIESESQEKLRRWMKGLKVKNHSVTSWITHYHEAVSNRPYLITGSSGLVEIVVNKESAAKTLGVTLETRIRVLKS
ncbi:MAG: SAM-dependent chlorinase/fluorinase [bacterium]